MGKMKEIFYSVIKVVGARVCSQWYFKKEDKARSKYEKESEKLKSDWGYNEDYPEGWRISESRTEYCSHDYDGDDDFYESVEMNEVQFED